MNVQNALNLGTKKLQNSPSPALDAEVLLAHVLKKDRTHLFANPKRKLTKLQATTYKLLIEKRLNHWPVAYLTGHKEFFGLDFLVTSDVLVPRPETETLVELALQATSYQLPATIIDVGTGSGNIIISIAKSLPSVILRSKATKNLNVSKKRSFAVAQDDTEVQFFAIDSSKQALAVARRNARQHGVAHKIKFLRGNLLEPLLQATSYQLQPALIIANLPYLTPVQYFANPGLKYEPKEALIGGRDGLRYFHELFKQIQSLTPSPGVGRVAKGQERSKLILLLEHDLSQKTKLRKLANYFLPQAKVSNFQDLTKANRFLQINF